MNKVAVYGSLREGLGNHRYFLKDRAEKLGTFTSEPNYKMFSLGGFPGLVEGGNTSAVMEVYEVSDELLLRLNALEGYRGDNYDGNLYNRTKIDTPYGKAFLYIFNISNRGTVNYPVVENGDWVEFVESRKQAVC